jgi:uncharacterized protein (DUF1684 family)
MDVLPRSESLLPMHRSLSDLHRLTLWEWRRLIAELYAEIRTLDPIIGWQRWRSTRDHLFRIHVQSPIALPERASFVGLNYFAYEPSLRFIVELDGLREVTSTTIAAGEDGEVTLLPFARTRGLERAVGAELTLFWVEGYGGGVFLPFGDATNGTESFAGGRYLLDTVKGADLGWTHDGKVVLDFNFAYNPSCSYSDQWVCPLAPPENKLVRPICAGERIENRAE